jgi:receptor expression-enhancing protein 5/6
MAQNLKNIKVPKRVLDLVDQVLFLIQLDGHLAHVPVAVQFEKATKVPKAYASLGLGSLLILMIFFNLWGNLLVNLLGFVYPAYASFKAIESPNSRDDIQWLTYWTVFGFMNVLEFFSDILLFWIPYLLLM